MRGLFVATVLCTSLVAHAQGTERDAAALALFNEGRELAARGDYEHACAKFEAARSAATWIGIQLNLADCYEHVGKSASAWVTFQQASDAAARSGDDRAAYARERASAIEPHLARVVIRVHAEAAGEVVTLDGAPVALASFGAAVPVDPGEHEIIASVSGRRDWTATVRAIPEQTVVVDVPAYLDSLHGTAMHPRVEPDRFDESRRISAPGRRTRTGVSLVLGGSGVAILGVSAVYGLKALHHRDDARDSHCDAHLVCDDYGVHAINAARHDGNISTLAAGIGLAAIGAAAVVYITSPREIVAVPIASPDAFGVSVQGAL